MQALDAGNDERLAPFLQQRPRTVWQSDAARGLADGRAVQARRERDGRIDKEPARARQPIV